MSEYSVVGRWILRIGFLLMALLGALAVGTWVGEACHAQTLSGPVRVIDGDTLEVQGQRVRLHGIDTPEKDQTCQRKGSSYHCGARALVALEDLLDGRAVTCTPTGKKSYDRTIARCFVVEALEQRDGRCCFRPHIDLGGWMVRNGHAIAYAKYSTDYLPQESVARGARLGIWEGTFIQPEQWRRGVR